MWAKQSFDDQLSVLGTRARSVMKQRFSWKRIGSPESRESRGWNEHGFSQKGQTVSAQTVPSIRIVQRFLELKSALCKSVPQKRMVVRSCGHETSVEIELRYFITLQPRQRGEGRPRTSFSTEKTNCGDRRQITEFETIANGLQSMDSVGNSSIDVRNDNGKPPTSRQKYTSRHRYQVLTK